MVASTESELVETELTQDAVENYFYVFADREVDERVACKLANYFNKESYYVDIDFDCEDIIDEQYLNIDIYGVVTEPEIC